MRLLLLILSVVTIVACSNQDTSEQKEDTNAENVETEADKAEEGDSKADSKEDSTEEAESEVTDNVSNEDEETEEETDEEENEAVEEINLLEDSEIVEGFWINYSGVDDARAHMSRTDFIDYDPTEDYTLTGAAYISYFYGDSFIKTNNYGNDGPYLIEKVDAADSIVVSMAKADQASVELLTGAVDEASSDEVENTTPDDLVGRGKPDTENIKGTILFGQDFLSGDDVTEGQRIDNKGNFIDAENYRITEALEYKPSSEYVVTSPVTISFYRNTQFIETVEITEAPAYLPKVDGANYINISFDEQYTFDLNIIEVE